MGHIGFIILFFFSVCSSILASKLKMLKIILTIILMTIILSFNHEILFESFLNPINNFNMYSVLVFLSAFLLYSNKLKYQNQSIFIAVLSIFSVNSAIIFYVSYEIFLTAAIILNSKITIKKDLLNLHYFCTFLAGFCILKFYTSNNFMFIGFAYFIFVGRFVYFLFLENQNFDFKFVQIINMIILGNLFFNNNLLFENQNITLIFLIFLTMFIGLNSFLFLKQKEFKNTYLLNSYILLALSLLILKEKIYFQLLSFVVLFILLKFESLKNLDYKLQNIYFLLFLMLTFFYELEILRTTKDKINFWYILIFFTVLLISKVKILLNLTQFLERVFIRRIE